MNEFAEQLKQEYPYKEPIIVPKCSEAFSIVDEDTTLGYPLGYSKEEPHEFSQLDDWRDRKIHLLGSNPKKQYQVIQKFTQPTITGDPPADIIGVDWNGPHKGALMGEYWTPQGWEPADHLSIRETVKRSLEEIKQYWQEQEVWPSTEPIEIHGPAVKQPDEHIYIDQGGNPITSQEALEQSHITECEEHGALAFQSKTQQQFIEWRECLEPL